MVSPNFFRCSLIAAVIVLTACGASGGTPTATPKASVLPAASAVPRALATLAGRVGHYRLTETAANDMAEARSVGEEPRNSLCFNVDCAALALAACGAPSGTPA